MLRAKAKQTKQAAILAAAARLFAGGDYARVHLEEIAAEAGVAKGTVYLYFENKEQLYLHLIQEQLGPMLVALREEVAGVARTSAWDGLELIVRRLFDFGAANPGLDEVLRISSHASLEAIMRPLGESISELMEKTIRSGIARGELTDSDPRLTAVCLKAMISKCRLLLNLQHEVRSPRELADHALQLIRPALVCKPVRNGATVRKGRARRDSMLSRSSR